jgi:hypothetical protein
MTKLTELSKSTLQSYIGNAVQDYGSQKSSEKRIKRYVGIDRAVSKLARGARVKATEGKTKMKKLREITKPDPVAYIAENFLDYLQATIQQKTSAKSEANIQEGLDATLEEFGFTDEAKTKAEALFYEAVSNKDSQLRDGIANLLGISPIVVEGFEVIDALADRIAELEDEISFIEQENLRLSSGLKGKLAENYNLNEATVGILWNNSNSFEDLELNLQNAAQPEPTSKRCFIEDQLEEINEDTTFANGEEYVDPRMAPYLRYFR